MDENSKTLPNMGGSTSQTVDEGVSGIHSTPSSRTQSGTKKRDISRCQLTSQCSSEITPRFLVVKRKEGDFANVSPFLIDKVLSSVVGVVPSVKKIRDGLLVEAASAVQARKLSTMEKFHDFDVSVIPHSTLNLTKGVVTCRDLLNCSLVEIIENMSDQGVIDAKRIMVRREGVLKETASIILTFNRPTLPKKVKAGIYVLPIRTYIPAPMRCFRCQRFGHTSSRCDKAETCECGKEPHIGSPCKEPIECVNCNGSHSARSRNCPVYKEEAAIQKIKTEEKISFAEARRRFKTSIATPTIGVSYSQALSSSPKSSASNEVIKDIVAKVIPDIVKICLDTIKQSNISAPSTSQDETSTRSSVNENEENPMETERIASPDKRKRGDNTPSDTECIGWEEQPNPESGTSRSRKGKTVLKKARPRKIVKKK